MILAIQVDSVSNALLVSYNRILTDGSLIVLNQIGSNNTVFSNWFGNNTLDLSKIVNLTMSNWIVINLKTLSNNVLVGDKVQF